MNQSKFQIRRRGRGIQVVNTETSEVIHSSGDQKAAEAALKDARKGERTEKAEHGDKTAGSGAGIAKTFDRMAEEKPGVAKRGFANGGIVDIGAGGGITGAAMVGHGATIFDVAMFGGSGASVDSKKLAEAAIERLATESGFVKMTPELASDMRQAAFIVETVAHLRGMAREYLPIAERLRKAAEGK